MNFLIKTITFLFFVFLFLIDLFLFVKWKEWDLPQLNQLIEANFSLIKIEKAFLVYSLIPAFLNWKKKKTGFFFQKQKLDFLISFFSALVMFFYLYFKGEIKNFWLVVIGAFFYGFFVFPLILFTTGGRRQTKLLPKSK